MHECRLCQVTPIYSDSTRSSVFPYSFRDASLVRDARKHPIHSFRIRNEVRDTRTASSGEQTGNLISCYAPQIFSGRTSCVAFEAMIFLFSSVKHAQSLLRLDGQGKTANVFSTERPLNVLQKEAFCPHFHLKRRVQPNAEISSLSPGRCIGSKLC